MRMISSHVICYEDTIFYYFCDKKVVNLLTKHKAHASLLLDTFDELLLKSTVVSKLYLFF